jgi:hypothetical protein
MEFAREREAWIGRKPYHLAIHRIADESKATIKIEVREEIPDRLPAILGDAVHNLRSALDHLAWALVEANGNTPNHRTQFPINYDLASFEEAVPRCLAGASDAAISAIKNLKPYKMGNNQPGNQLLYAVHELDIIDKHRLIVAVANVYTAADMRFSNRPDPAETGFQWFGEPFKMDHSPGAMVIKDGQPVADVIVDAEFPLEVYVHAQATVQMLFGDGSSPAGQRVGEFLENAGREIGAIIDYFNTQFFQ